MVPVVGHTAVVPVVGHTAVVPVAFSRGSRGVSRGGSRSVPMTLGRGYTSSFNGSTGREQSQQQQRTWSRSPSSPARSSAAAEDGRTPFYESIRVILDESGHHLLPHRHPQRPPRTLWYIYFKFLLVFVLIYILYFINLKL